MSIKGSNGVGGSAVAEALKAAGVTHAVTVPDWVQLPSLVTIASSGAANLVHIVFNNGVWFENLANIPVPGAQVVDFAATAKAVGFKHALRVGDKDGLVNALTTAISKGGPALIELVIEPEKAGVWMKDNPQPDLADFHFNRLGIELHRVHDALLQQGAA